ncbi:TauD/TfdA family dioxygenase [Thalassococcus sp. S3]|uniref:TauD/TfdA dioxygenase family protein n=1 Tax=Thalassococcus sp. S3 TaxID=2017482 RepID=UPI0020C42E1C|nr:TauD/TfdA family dioxygenase [Thalassococcus sp. S3]
MALKTSPLHPLFGVEVHGSDLRGMTEDRFADLRALFEQHSALLFRNQKLDDADHIQLAECFGPIEDRNADSRNAGDPFRVPEVSNILSDGRTSDEMDLHTLNLKANMLWHSDSTFLPVPALTNILIARVVTETGGQTELASTRAAWSDMPETLKSRIRDRGFWHRYAHSRARISPELAKLDMFQKWPDQLWRAVWTNPVTGQEALYIASHAFAVEGMDESEGTALIDQLMSFVTQRRYVFSHTWNVGDVLIWDQRAVLHRATPWNYDEPRKLTSICTSATRADGLNAMRMGIQHT